MLAKCNRDLLEVYLDGEASVPETVAIEAHLAGCIECRQAARNFKRTKECLGAMQAIEPPEAIRQRAQEAAAGACNEVLQLLDSFVDDELSAPSRFALSLHFGLCEKCRREVAIRRQLRGLVAALPQADAPAAVRAKARAALGGVAGERQKAGLWEVLRPAFAGSRIGQLGAAVAAICALAAIVWLHPFGSRPEGVKQPPATAPVVGTVAENVEEAAESAAPEMAEAPAAPATEPDAIAVAAAPSTPATTTVTERRRISVRRLPHRTVASAPESASVVTASYDTGGTAMSAAPPRDSELRIVAEAIARAEATKNKPPSQPERREVARISNSLPREIAEARISMMRAAEEHHVLSLENMLTSAPDKVDNPEMTPHPTKPEMPESDVARPRGGALV